jgi:hypothetical protein
VCGQSLHVVHKARCFLCSQIWLPSHTMQEARCFLCTHFQYEPLQYPSVVSFRMYKVLVLRCCVPGSTKTWVLDHSPFGTHLSVGGCQLTKERILYSSDIRRSQFKVRVNKLLGAGPIHLLVAPFARV